MFFQKNLLLFVTLYLLSACGGDNENHQLTNQDTPLRGEDNNSQLTNQDTSLRRELLTKAQNLNALERQLYLTKDKVSCDSTYKQMVELEKEILETQKKNSHLGTVSINMSKSNPCTISGFLLNEWKFQIHIDIEIKEISSSS